MLSLQRILRRVQRLFAGGQRNEELDEEMQSHIEMETAKHVRAGMSEAEAHVRALRDFGGVARFRDETRDAHGVRAIEDFIHDVRIGVRGLLRQRTFATVAILTLAIGIGGTTAVFGAVYASLLAPLPYRDADRVMTLWQTDTKDGTARNEVSVPNFLDWRERSRSFSHMAIAEPFSLDYIGPDGPEVFNTALVTEGFFEALGVRPILGRTFLSEEFVAGKNQVVIISESLWRTRFGADSSLLNRPIVLDGAPMVLVGVMPRSVDVPWGSPTWAPKIIRPDELQARTSAYYSVVARLRDGVSIEAAQRDLSSVASDLAREYAPTNATTGASVVPVADALLGAARSRMYTLFGAMGFVLLIACVNVASLQLAQAVRRRRELATRATLGAGSGRLARQLFTECFVLAAVGGVLGLALAYGGLAGIRAIAPVDLPRVEDLQLQPVVIAFAFGITVLTALVFGLAPVLEARRMHLSEVISSGGRTVAGTRTRRRVQNALVITEIALALVLMVGAGLLVRSLRSLVTIDRGFEPSNVLVTTVQAWSFYRTPGERIAFAREAIERLRALPGVEAAGMSSSLPLSDPIGAEFAPLSIEGQPTGDGRPPVAHIEAVTPGYFDALRIPLRAGRTLATSDRDSSTAVALVNEAFVRRYWPNEKPLGKRIGMGFQRVSGVREVVGVVADVRHEGLDRAAEPSVFIPHSQGPTGAMNLVLRTNGDPRALEKPVRVTLASMNGSMPVSAMTTLDELFDTSLRDRRFQLALLGAFSVVALLLSAIGIYGVLSQTTSERTQEIGVRVAIGATAGQVLMMVVRQGAMLAAVGIAIGLAGAAALTRFLKSMLFEVTPFDPLTFVASLTLLFAAAIIACWIPARRAAAVDPVTALRD
ncbi:MAG TPA: ABC transporter permease [Gemmatimonadaceae bacterium]|nr:ABC transporter permease [Gemmatimonadaceae bacterium]